MIYASGYVETNQTADTDRVRATLEDRNIETGGVVGDRLVFLIGKETAGEVKSELETLGEIDGVRSVYMSYFSVDGADG